MNLLFSEKDRASSGISISRVEKKQLSLAKAEETCLQCGKKEKELNEVIHMKSQTESKYNELVLNLQLQLKSNSKKEEEYLSLNNNYNKLKDEYSLKQHEVIQLEDIITSLKEKLKIQQQAINHHIPFESKNKALTDADEAFDLQIKRQYEIYGKQICELEAQNSSLLIGNSKLKKQIEMLRLVNVKLTSESSKLIDENRELLLTQRQLRIDNEELSIKCNSIEQINLEAKQQLDKEREERTKVKRELKSIKMTNGNLSSIASGLEAENKKIKTEYAVIQNEKEGNKVLTDLTMDKQIEMESAILNLTNENNLLLEENMQLKHVISDYQRRIQHLSSSSTQNKIDKGNVNQLNSLISQLRNQIETQEDEIMKLTHQTNFLKLFYEKQQSIQLPKESASIFKPKDRNGNLIDDFEEKFVQYETEKHKLASIVTKLQKDSINKQDVIATLNKHITNLRAQISETDVKNLYLQEENCKLNQDIVSMKLSAAELAEMNIKLQAEKEEIAVKMDQNKESLESANRTKQAMHQISNAKEEIILKLNSEILLKDKLIDENRDVVFEQSKIIEECKETVSALELDKESLLRIIHKKKLT